MPVPRPRSAMRKIREILRLALGEGLSRRATGAATGLPYTTVSDHLVRAVKAGLGWPLPDGMDDAQLEARLFLPLGAGDGSAPAISGQGRAARPARSPYQPPSSSSRAC